MEPEGALARSQQPNLVKGIMQIADSRALPAPPCGLLGNASLFLDLDGTLLEIASRPGDVIVDDSLKSLLARLVQYLGGRLAVVSGRPAAEVRRLLGPVDLAIAGSHGAEYAPAHGIDEPPVTAPPPPVVSEALRQLQARHPGVLVEAKPFGLALHYRLAPVAAEACHALAQRIASAEGYILQPGKQVIELKYHDSNKGDAVRMLMASEPMTHGRPLFIGDDLTDEAGFAAARALGGAGILVGPPRPTAASYGLADVGAALRWLSRCETVG